MYYLVPSLLLLSLVSPAHAAYDGPGAPQTVKDASAVATAAKDSHVQLEGNIVRKVQDELYLFKDASGEVLVEIDDDLTANRNITPDTKVRLQGEVDSEDGKPSVEVEMLEVLN